MPAILWRIFLIYNLFLYLVPKKLRPFFLPFTLGPSKSTPSTAASPPATPSPATAASLPPSVPQRPRKVMDPAELRRVFQMFDRNGDGRITRKELGDSLENLGIFVPGKELEDMIRRVDANGDGCVDMDEFEALYRSIMEERVDEEDMKEAFDVFDRNGDGFITIDELRAVMASLGLKQGRTVEDCRQMITRVDVDGDGRVNFKEFKQMMKGGGFRALS